MRLRNCRALKTVDGTHISKGYLQIHNDYSLISLVRFIILKVELGGKPLPPLLKGLGQIEEIAGVDISADGTESLPNVAENT